MSVVYDEKLLDKTGLAMVPSAYKGAADEGNTGGFLGKVYSVLPAQTTSDNLVTNGDFSDGTTDWLPHGDAATQISVVNGKLYIEAATAFDGAKQSLVLDNGSYYKLKADIELDTATRVRVYASSGNLGLQEFTQDGSIEITFDGTSTSNTIVFDCGSVIGNFYIDNVSLVRITDGDFDFSRGSDATRVNSQGYIESVQIIGDELVQNGDFGDIGSELITYSDLFYGSGGWSLVNNKWVFDDVTAGYIQHPAFSVVVGQIYKVTIDVSVPSGVANFRFSSGNAQTILFNYTDFSDGITTFYAKVSGVDGVITRLFSPTTLSDSFTLNSINVQRVGQNWTFGDGWSMGDGKAVCDGTQTTTTYLNQSGTIISPANKKYKIKFTISDYVSGGVGVYPTINGIGSYALAVANGDYVHYYEAPSSATNTTLYIQANGTFQGSIDNISVVEVTDDTDIPRLDYSDGCPTLLLEPERINTAFENGDFVTSSSASTAYNYGISPSGKKDSIKLESTSTGASYIRTSPLTTIGTQACSVFVKKGVGDYAQLIQAGSGNHFANFDLTSGTVTLEGSTTSASVKDYGDWLRLIAVFDNVTSSAGSFRLYLSDSATAGFGGAPSAVGNYLEFWGFQVEIGDYVTSYIENTTPNTTVTRLADICNNAGDSTIFNNSEGVLFIETLSLNNSNDSGVISIRGNQTPSVNLVTLKLNYSSNTIQFFIYNNGNLDINRTINYDLSNPIKLAIKYSVEESSIWVNGKQEFGGIIGFTGFSANNLKDISFDTFSSEPLEAKVRSVLYFNEALSNAELEYITSSDIDVVLQNNKLKATMLGDTYEDGHVEDRLNELF